MRAGRTNAGRCCGRASAGLRPRADARLDAHAARALGDLARGASQRLLEVGTEDVSPSSQRSPRARRRTHDQIRRVAALATTRSAPTSKSSASWPAARGGQGEAAARDPRADRRPGCAAGRPRAARSAGSSDGRSRSPPARGIREPCATSASSAKRMYCTAEMRSSSSCLAVEARAEARAAAPSPSTQRDVLVDADQPVELGADARLLLDLDEERGRELALAGHQLVVDVELVLHLRGLVDALDLEHLLHLEAQRLAILEEQRDDARRPPCAARACARSRRGR